MNPRPAFPRGFHSLLLATVLLAAPSALAQDTGTLRDSDGAIMRGTPMVLGRALPASVAFSADAANWASLRAHGFNTVRVCWVDPWYVQHGYSYWSIAEMLPHLDTCVARAAAAGMNIIINYHNVGEQNESLDFTLLAAFWQAVAARYRDQTHVFYELSNEPTFNASRYLLPAFRSGLLAIYDQVHADAPDRQVLLFSFNSLDHDLAEIVDAYADALDWANTSVAYHMYAGPGGTTTSAKLRELSARYRLICTEWDYPGRWDYVPVIDGDPINAQTLERLGHSWIDWRDWGDTRFDRLYEITLPDARAKAYGWAAHLDAAVPGHLTNLSARGLAGTADDTLVVGYVVRGASTAVMPTLIRGVGPTLRAAPFNLATAIGDPVLTLFRGPDAIATNDQWRNSDGAAALPDLFASLGAFALPAASADAALRQATAGGAVTTVHVTNRDGASGLALAEIYDASPAPGADRNAARLANISVRAAVRSGADVLIGGFVINGNVPRQVLLRGGGPVLRPAPFNVSTAVPDPALRLYRADGSFLQGNDNWLGTDRLRDAAALVGAFPWVDAASADAAMLLTLQPGIYSVHLAASNDVGGVGLIEIYELP